MTSDGDFRTFHSRGAEFRKVTFFGSKNVEKSIFLKLFGNVSGRSEMVSGDRKWVGEVSKLDFGPCASARTDLSKFFSF